MEINIGTKDTPVDVEVIIKHKNGKDVNLNGLSPQSLLDILQEVTNEFSNIQESIESILDDKNPSGECYFNGEKKHWSQHISDSIVPPR
jgi:hypothetical protein